MLESNSPSKTFLGVRFLLLGFDPLGEQEVRSKLVDCGGVDVGHYSPDCTHVIVDKFVYGDPICVAARNDAKTLVTALWVHDSFDIGMPVDATSIIYRPLKDLNGIPGAKNLVVCLTGYQRQDREDIMTMVGLMGAQFSKSLVANKVTHLVCYKFEGEKYDLAKKVSTMKLVNHRWLEDCLRDWALLPEDNYNKSGYEMEIMEAEARDSEDEAENHFVMQSGVRSMYKSPHNVKSGFPAASGLLKSEGEMPKVPMNFDSAMDNSSGMRSVYKSPHNIKSGLPESEREMPKVPMNFDNFMENSSAGRSMHKSPHNIKSGLPATSGLPKSEGEMPKVPMNFDNAMYNSYIPQDENKLDQASSFSNVDVSKGLSCQDACRFRDVLEGGQNDQHHRISDPKVRLNLTPNSRTGEKPALSAGKLSQSRQTTWNSTLPLHMGAKSGDGCRSSKVPIRKVNANDDLGSSSFKENEAYDKIGSNCFRAPLKGTHLQNGEESSGILPQKRTMNLSFASSKSLKMSHDAKSGIMSNPSSSDKSSKVNTTYLIDASYETTGHHIVRSDDHSPDKTGRLNALENSTAGVSPAKSSTFIHKSSACDLPVSATLISETGQDGNINKRLTTFQRLRKSSLSSKPGIVDSVGEKSTTAVSKTVEQQTQRQDVADSYPNNKSSVPKSSNNHVNLNWLNGGNNDLITKPVRKKTLGSRHELTSADQNGNLVDDTSLNDATVNLNAGEHEEFPNAINMDVLSPGVNAEAPMEVEGRDVTMSAAVAENRHESLDDETEAPEEEGEHILENVVQEAKAIEVQSTSKSDTFTEEKSEALQHTLDHSDSVIQGDAMAPVETTKENTVSDKIPMLVESTTEVDDDKGKKNKGNKRTLSKTRLKTVPVVTNIMKPKKVVCEDDPRNENMGATEEEEKRLACLVGKSKCRIGAKIKLENSSELKENRPVVCGDQNVSKAKQQARKSMVKSDVTPMEINQTSEERQVKAVTPVKMSSNSSMPEGKASSKVKTQPVWFILSGHRFQRKDFQQVIRRLKGRCCRDSHHWSYQATHFIAPDPIKRTEKFFAAAASGRWILNSDYLAASNQAGRFLAEEPYEWYKNGLSEDGAINLEAPRKWRLLRERTGHCAFHRMRIIIYGECIAPSLDTLKRVVKAGDGTILATSPPYTRFLNSGVDFAIVSPGMPRVDVWVQEFLKHEIPCVVADYLVEYVCKPGYPLERHVLHNTHAWAEKSFGSLQRRAEEVVEEDLTPCENYSSGDIPCVVCGSGERGEVMLICGNESGSIGCGVGTHIDCCNPPLKDVPEDDWLCPKCSSSSQSKNSTNSCKKSKKGKSK